MLKRILSLLMVLVMVGGMLPSITVHSHVAASENDITVFTDEDYAVIDDVFAQIDAMEEIPAKKNATEAELADAAAELVMASDNYVAGSLERKGNSFTWWTDEGIRCVYSPRMREIESEMVASETPAADGAYNEPAATKGGWPSGNQVYLIGPYYGYDDSFTDQYKNEAKAIAAAIGDTDGYTLYSGTAATVDKVAEAMSKGAVVIFDSHGNTDYENGYDYVTGATSSYLCMKSTSGLTDADYADGALYYNDGIWINGATIANHMTKNSPSGLLWMAICLGMATDTICQPMREKGVEVVYGYSQSVTFGGDYLYEETFWDNMCAGKDVATSIANMKSTWGEWDWSVKMANEYGYNDGYSTISAARADYAAFPIVVSDEDTHPGQRNKNIFYGADSLQTVKSTYTLFSQYNVTAQSNNTAYGTVSVSGTTITAKPATGYFAQSATVSSGKATVSQSGNTFSVVAESDCVIQINFAPKTAVTVSFSGATVPAQSGYAGDAMSLPAEEAPEGYTFLGWMTAPLAADTTEKPTFHTDSFIPTGNITLYALYSYVDENSGTGTGDYKKVTQTPDDWSGEYVIVYEATESVFDSTVSNVDDAGNHKTVTITNNTISAEDADAYKFTVAAADNGYSFQNVNGKYFGNSGKNVTLSDSVLEHTISIDASGNAVIQGTGNYLLRYNKSANRFRYYTSGQESIALYLKDGSAGTTYYTGTTAVCEHTNTTEVPAVDATCTTPGYTAGVQCSDCGNVISGHTIVEALGHTWDEWKETIAPACTTAGEETQTCATCQATQTQTVAATGHNIGEGVVTTAPTCTAEGVMTYTCGICGHATTEAISATGHDYTTEVTDPTASQQGYTTYTCNICGDSYTSDYTYLVSFHTPAGVAKVESMICGENGITLPGAGVPTGEIDYAFAGWVAVKTEDTEERPSFYEKGQTYYVTQSTVLYALYSYEVESESGTGDYVKVTEAPADWSGEYVIVYEAGKRIFDGSLSKLDAANNFQKVTISNGVIPANQAEPYKFMIVPTNGNYSIQSVSGKFIGRSANSNGIDESTTASANTITLKSDGTVEIKGTGGASLRYNNGTSASENRFRYYKSGQQSICLYKKDGAGVVTHYTTQIGENPVISWNVTLADEITVGFKLDITNANDVIAKINGQEVGVFDAQTGLLTVPVAAAQMADEITITVDGEELKTTYSVVSYARYILDNESDPEIKTLVTRMLMYGSAAQTYFEYPEAGAALADACLNDSEKLANLEIKEVESMSVTGATEGIKFYGASLLHKDKLGVRLYFTGDISTQSSTVTFGDEVVQCTPVANDTMWYIELNSIDPHELASKVVARIGEGDTALTVTYSPMDYIVRMYNNKNASDDLRNLVVALYGYYKAAEAYVK